MKDPAQVAYEVHARSFGITSEQQRKSKPPVFGPIPWPDVDPTNKLRWKMIAEAVINQQQANMIETSSSLIRDVRAKQPTLPPSETFQCSECGAKMMVGENHDCKIIQAHRRKLGHRLPTDR